MTAAAWLRCAAATLLLFLLLVFPNRPEALGPEALARFPLELPVILLVLVALPRGASATIVRILLVAILTLVTALKAADIAMSLALARPFNAVADMPLVAAGLRLLSGAIGSVPAFLVACGSLAALGMIAALGWWATGVWSRTAPRGAGTPGAIAAAVAIALAVAQFGQSTGRWQLPVTPPGSTAATRIASEQAALAGRTLAALRSFARSAADDPYAARPDVLNAIDRDVILVFVESYGRASFDNELYAPTHLATLRAAEARLSDRGLAMRSGWLRAPTRGGQSWLSHATFANGLWVDNQTSYGAILASPRDTLFHLARRAGFRTAAVMPQITLDWPESARMGFDTVLAASDLGYAGKPFNWVTMPDQYTYSALERRLRAVPRERPLLVQVATGSSHAPWVPVPSMVPWEEIGDGRVFDEMAESGDTPQEVWRDRDRVRTQYRKAIDYALTAVFDYAARQAEDPPLFLVVGDHQPAEFVAGDDSPQVAMHVVGPPDLVARIDEWDWTEGLVPAEDLEVRSMAAIRDLLIEAFTQDTRASRLSPERAGNAEQYR